jgi:hypothetical protein
MDQAISVINEIKDLAIGSAGLPQMATNLAVDGYVRTGWRLGKLHKQRNEEKLVKAMERSVVYFDKQVAANAKTVLSGSVDGIVSQTAPRIMHLLRRQALLGQAGIYIYFLIVAMCIRYADTCSFEDVMSMLGCCLSDEDVILERSLTTIAVEMREWATNLIIDEGYQDAWGQALIKSGNAFGVSITDIPILALSQPSASYVPKSHCEAMCLRHLARTGLLPHRTTTPSINGFYVPLGLSPIGGSGRLLDAELRVLTWQDAITALRSNLDKLEWTQAAMGNVGKHDANPRVEGLEEILNILIVPMERRGLARWAVAQSICQCGSCRELVASMSRLPSEQIAIMPTTACMAVRQYRNTYKLQLVYWAVTENTWFGTGIYDGHIIGIAKVKDCMQGLHPSYKNIIQEGTMPIGVTGPGMTYIDNTLFSAALAGCAGGCFFVNGERLISEGDHWFPTYILPASTTTFCDSPPENIANDENVFEKDNTGNVTVTAEFRFLNPWVCLDLQFMNVAGNTANITVGNNETVKISLGSGSCSESCGGLDKAATVSGWGVAHNPINTMHPSGPIVVYTHNNPMGRLLSALFAKEKVYVQGTECLKCAYTLALQQNCIYLIDGSANRSFRSYPEGN